MSEESEIEEAKRVLAWVYHRSRNGLFSFKRSRRDAALSDINAATAGYADHWRPAAAKDPHADWFGEQP